MELKEDFIAKILNLAFAECSGTHVASIFMNFEKKKQQELRRKLSKSLP